MKKLIALFLVTIMLLSSIPVALAVDNTVESAPIDKYNTVGAPLDNSRSVVLTQGRCGSNLYWTIDTDGLLKISGSGAMNEFITNGSAPWSSVRSWIEQVEIGNSVTSISQYAFYDCTNLSSVTIGTSVKTIGSGAFSYCDSLSDITIPASVSSIGYMVFSCCFDLDSITFLGNTPTFSNGALYNIGSSIVAYYPAGDATWTDDVIQQLSSGRVSWQPFFADVDLYAFYYDPVMWAVDNGITSGTSAITFKPDKACTRAEVVTFLWRAMGKPTPSSTEIPFSDVAANTYYTQPVLWAVENGITGGTGGGKFSPNKVCTRAEVVTFLWRTMGNPVPSSAEIPFADIAANTYYTQPVLWAVENGITGGTGGDKFSPNMNCSRGQIVTFLYRCMNEGSN